MGQSRAYRPRADDKTMQHMGMFLLKKRKQHERKQSQVADAIDRHFQYVSDVEHGRRGKAMDPFVAMKWAHYLHFDPMVLFRYIGLVDESGRTQAVIRHLSGVVMAQNLIRSQRLIAEVESTMRRTQINSRDLVLKGVLADQRRDLQLVMALLKTPQNGKVNVPEKSSLAV